MQLLCNECLLSARTDRRKCISNLKVFKGLLLCVEVFCPYVCLCTMWM